MHIFKRLWRFIKYNKFKRLSLLCWIYSAWYRFSVLHIDSKRLHKKWGAEGEESPDDETLDTYRYAKKVSYCVNQICSKTAWESKCLVRALTAQKLLKRKKISTTLYLGCAEKDGKMVAHAWLRCGRLYVTGGDGTGYTIVDKFCT